MVINHLLTGMILQVVDQYVAYDSMVSFYFDNCDSMVFLMQSWKNAVPY